MGMEEQTRAREWDQGLNVIKYEGMLQGGESVLKQNYGEGCIVLILMKSMYMYSLRGKFHGKAVKDNEAFLLNITELGRVHSLALKV